MLTSERMLKFKAVVVDTHLDKLLWELGKSGAVEIKTYDGELPKMDVAANIQEYQDLFIDIEPVIDSLPKRYEGDVDTSLLKGKSYETLKRQIAVFKRDILDVKHKIKLLRDREADSARLNKVKAALKESGVSPDMLGHQKYSFSIVVVIKEKDFLQFKNAIEEEVGETYIAKLSTASGLTYGVVSALTKHQQEIERIFRIYQVHEYTREELAREPEDVASERETLEKELEKNIKKHNRDIALYERFILNKIKIAEVKRNFGATARTAVIAGWIPVLKEKDFREVLRNNTGKIHHLELNEPGHGDDPPIKLPENKYLKPFEDILTTFGVQGYNEINPTIFIAITFPIIFGLMFGDVGHGAIFIVGGYALYKYFKMINEATRNMFMYCGTSAVFFGFMYGEVFGMKTIIHHMWFSPEHELMKMFSLALIIGFAQICFGMALSIINHIREKEYIGMLTEPFPRLFMYVGGTYLIILSDFNIFNIANYTSLLGVILGVPAVLIIAGLYHKSRQIGGSISFGLFEILDSMISFLSNTVSYGRILALALTHSGMSGMIVIIVSMMFMSGTAGMIMGIILFVIATLLVMALEGLIVYVHTLRLHYYEWFTKFFSGKGRRFKSFEIE